MKRKSIELKLCIFCRCCNTSYSVSGFSCWLAIWITASFAILLRVSDSQAARISPKIHFSSCIDIGTEFSCVFIDVFKFQRCVTTCPFLSKGSSVLGVVGKAMEVGFCTQASFLLGMLLSLPLPISEILILEVGKHLGWAWSNGNSKFSDSWVALNQCAFLSLVSSCVYNQVLRSTLLLHFFKKCETCVRTSARALTHAKLSEDCQWSVRALTKVLELNWLCNIM